MDGVDVVALAYVGTLMSPWLTGKCPSWDLVPDTCNALFCT
jgi:hypothetical protein